MSKITIGDLAVSADDDGLVIQSGTHRVRIDPDGASELLDFLRSCSINESNQRRSFRVPLTPESGLTVRLQVGPDMFSVRPRDISLTGIFVEFVNFPSSLGVDVVVGVELGLDHEKLTVPAVIRRVVEDGIGLNFGESDTNKPPSALAGMVMELQRAWLKRRMIT